MFPTIFYIAKCHKNYHLFSYSAVFVRLVGMHDAVVERGLTSHDVTVAQNYQRGFFSC